MPRTILGLDIGGTKTAVVLGDHAGHIFDRTEFLTRPQRGFEPAFAELIEHANAMLANASASRRPAGAVSVSIGGPLSIDAGIVLSPPNLPGWDNIPLRTLLEERTRLPVYVEHDGNAGALAEWYFGAARGAQNVIFLTAGTGFGAGLILNGRLYRGTCDLAGEVGHVRIAATGPTAFGKAGSWEALCGGAGIAKLAGRLFPNRWTAEDAEHAVTTRDLADLARAGDTDALAVFDEVGRHLGRGLAMLVDILNPDVIVLGSLAVRLGEPLLAPARQVVAREALPPAVAACRIVPAGLGERLGDVAGLTAAIHALRGPQ